MRRGCRTFLYGSFFQKYHQKQMLRNDRQAAGLAGGRTFRTMETLTFLSNKLIYNPVES